MRRVSLGLHEGLRHALRGRERGRGHNVEIARVRRQIMRGAFDLDEYRGFQAAKAAKARWSKKP